MKKIHEMRYSILDVATVPISEKFGANVVGLLMSGITLAFLLMYLRRFIVIAFLMMIAPLITITYAIDKVKDGQSQALDTWRKEFFWTVLIQPFHCLIFLVFVPASYALLKNGNIGSSFMAIFCMIFIFQAEDIVRKIFGIKADDIKNLSAASALVAGGVIGSFNKAKSLTPSQGGGKGASQGKGGGSTPRVKNTQNPVSPNQGGGSVASGVTATNTTSSGNTNTSQQTNNTNNTNNSNSINSNASTGATNQNTGQNANNRGMEYQNELNKKFMNSDKVRSAREMLANVLRTSEKKSKTGRIIGGVAKTGLGVSLATLSLLDNPGGTKTFTSFVAGYGAGEFTLRGIDSMRNYGADKLKASVEKSRLKNRNSDFDSAYDEYRRQNNATPEEMKQKITKLMDIDLNSSQEPLTDAERKLATTAQRLYDQLDKMEYKNPLEEIIKKIDKKK